uniref:Uncharacterized protein n=1 Tax=Solanum tuberosum TaxID=4113 RepID=M0ZVY3_SOLTU
MGSYFVSVELYLLYLLFPYAGRTYLLTGSSSDFLNVPFIPSKTGAENDVHVFFSITLQSWLRVSQRFHTLNQVAVGAILGFCFSIFWFWLWDAIVMKAFINHFWVRIVAVVGAASFCVGFLLYVIRNWVIEDLH